MTRRVPKLATISRIAALMPSGSKRRSASNEARQLHDHIRAIREPAHAVTPKVAGRIVAARWIPCMREHEAKARMGIGQLGGLPASGRARLQVEAQAALAQKREPGAPLRRAKRRPGAPHLGEISLLQPIAHPDEERRGARMGVEDRAEAGGGEDRHGR